MITLICRATEHCPTELKGGRQVEGRLCGHSQAVLVQLRSTSATPVQCKAGSDLQIPLFSLRRKESLFKKKNVPLEMAIFSGMVNVIISR